MTKLIQGRSATDVVSEVSKQSSSHRRIGAVKKSIRSVAVRRHVRKRSRLITLLSKKSAAG